MEVRYRPMEPKDIHKCVEHVAAHPILGPRYGNLIELLPSAINHALGYDFTAFHVLEKFSGTAIRFLGAIMAVFVSDEFLHQAKNSPQFWVGPELVKGIKRGNSPLLSNLNLRESNSSGGLNLVIWHASPHPADFRAAELGTPLIKAFVESHRGFQLREVFAQADCMEHLSGMRNAGAFYFDRVRDRYGEFPAVNAENFSDEPRSTGMTRDLASVHGGSWLCSLFLYPSPQVGFSRSEQRLLIAALAGITDEELSGKLSISVFGVKKIWRRIHDRAAERLPDLATDNAQAHGDRQVRGKQKRQHLLA